MDWCIYLVSWQAVCSSNLRKRRMYSFVGDINMRIRCCSCSYVWLAGNWETCNKYLETKFITLSTLLAFTRCLIWQIFRKDWCQESVIDVLCLLLVTWFTGFWIVSLVTYRFRWLLAHSLCLSHGYISILYHRVSKISPYQTSMTGL